jgi:hypothetical protein
MSREIALAFFLNLRYTLGDCGRFLPGVKTIEAGGRGRLVQGAIMKKMCLALALCLTALAGVFAQDKPFTMGVVLGASTVDGVTYKQIGLQPKMRFGKLGLGLDINLLMDETGAIRKEDWDDVGDYLDKLYYISWAQRGEPFYFKLGAFDKTAPLTLGYGILMSRYTNTTEYPTYKRWGLDIGFETPYVGGQAFVANFKDLDFKDFKKSGPVLGTRIYAKPGIPWIQIGLSSAMDLNEYKGLRDNDGDGWPDRIDQLPYDGGYHTMADYYYAKLKGSLGSDAADVVGALQDEGLIDRAIDTSYVPGSVSRVFLWAADLGFELVGSPDSFALGKHDFLKFQLYAQFARSFQSDFLAKEGWGLAPGVKFGFGSIGEIYAEFRHQTKGFQIGYFDETYDLQRAVFKVDEGTGIVYPVTKKQSLPQSEALSGVYAGWDFNIAGYLLFGAGYKYMLSGQTDETNQSLRVSLGMGEELKNLVKIVSRAEAYYVHNNLDDVKKLFKLDEGTMWGAALGYAAGEGVSIELEYSTVFVDRNGDGEINFKKESDTHFSILTSVSF